MGEGMIYTVKDIQEDLDYGCEERMEGTPLMVVVILEDENGAGLIKKIMCFERLTQGNIGQRIFPVRT